MDYVFRRLALDYLSFEDRSMLGIYSAEERQRHLETGSYEPIEETGGAEELMAVEVAELIEDDASRWSSSERSERLETTKVVEQRAKRADSRDHSDATRSRPPRSSPPPGEAHTSAELFEKITGTAVDSPLCMTCGTKMRPAGSCFVCEGCGSTSGCS